VSTALLPAVLFDGLEDLLGAFHCGESFFGGDFGAVAFAGDGLEECLLLDTQGLCVFNIELFDMQEIHPVNVAEIEVGLLLLLTNPVDDVDVAVGFDNDAFFFEIVEAEVRLAAEDADLALRFDRQARSGDVGDAAVFEDDPRVADVLVLADDIDADGVDLADRAGGQRQDDVDIMNLQRATRLEKKDFVEIELENGAVLKSKTVILSTGARWRTADVPGEEEFRNKGIAYCAHCDGPLFAGKDVAVIGGGNSGIEAAIDLAGLVKHVTLFARSKVKADPVLQDRVYSLPNVTVIENAQIKEITGTDKVNGITYNDCETGDEHHIELQGVFVQIGTVPNTEWLGDTIERNRSGEIVVDKNGSTSIPGVFAAGDCTDTSFKQIIISMGSGATAALGAFDYLIRN